MVAGEDKLVWKKIKKNHGLMMILCCAIPLVLLIIATKIFNLNGKYLFWFILLLCPLMHFFMMKDTHKKHGKEEKNKENDECH
ncbi:hypothetical protein COV14_04865 [Candidatus Woesearchaeota archaeon CG10_big_fil_rev_8_21_14_0_10_33_12]|nr:MAG: hypothetical protein COV14_04865 [Candidatus Woesearchaeota archaeon CG10_big_fil_rev_8_21_14_0_10_33_12]